MPEQEPELDLSVKLKTRTVLLVLVEIVLTIPVIMILWWVFGYMGGVDWSSSNKYKFNWHPIAMIIGMFFLFGNGRRSKLGIVVCKFWSWKVKI